RLDECRGAQDLSHPKYGVRTRATKIHPGSKVALSTERLSRETHVPRGGARRKMSRKNSSKNCENLFFRMKKMLLTLSACSVKLRLGRCSSCDLEHRQMATDGVNSFVRRVGSRSWSVEINRRSALLGEKLKSWSLLLAAVSDRAASRGVPKGSSQDNRATATNLILGRFFPTLVKSC